MSAGADGAEPRRPAEERAEELMSRVTGSATRVIGRFVGRAREELEDIVAEARALNEGHDTTGPTPPAPAPAPPPRARADS